MQEQKLTGYPSLKQKSNMPIDTSYKVFQPTDKSMFWTMFRSEFLQRRLNKTPIWNIPKRNWLFKKLVASIDGTAYCVQPPFHISDGSKTHIGKNFFANYNCVIMDHGGVHIGDNVLLAPNVSILTVSHPFLAEQRIIRKIPNSFEPHGRGNYELIASVKVGNNVWIATGAIICPGVTIGNNAVIGAGSVVTKDIPPNTFACGVPAKVIREITEEDRLEINI